MELEKWLIEFRPHDSHCEATVILSSKNWELKNYTYLTLFIDGPQHTLDILDKACYNLLNSRISDNIMKQSKFWISIESQNVK